MESRTNNTIVQYSIAFIDGKERTINISDVREHSEQNPQYRYEHRFICPGCGKELRAVLGKKQAVHFRHIGEKGEKIEPCQHDNYLHSTAEQVFFEEYKNCLEEKRDFVVETYPKDSIRRTKTVLTDEYKIIKPEKTVFVNGHYRRPDLLLQSDEGKQLWVEIWVNHKTDDAKKKDNDILEIKITSEEDIEKIRTHKLIQESPISDNVKLYLKDEDTQQVEPVIISNKDFYNICRLGIAAIHSVCSAKIHNDKNPDLFDTHWYHLVLSNEWKHIFNLLEQLNFGPSIKPYGLKYPPSGIDDGYGSGIASRYGVEFHAKINPDEKDPKKIYKTARSIVEKLIPYINYIYFNENQK